LISTSKVTVLGTCGDAPVDRQVLDKQIELVNECSRSELTTDQGLLPGRDLDADATVDVLGTQPA